LKKAYGVITTHYQNLKHFADSHEGVVNGAMLYDRQEMQALFQLSIGQPGSSFAIEIARKTGIPEEVIRDASEIVGSDYIQSDKYLQDIVRDKRYWESKRQTIHQREKDMEKTIARYESDLNDIAQSRKDILRRAKEQAEELLLESNKKIENAIREIREGQAEKEQTARIKGLTSTGKIESIDGKMATVIFGDMRTKMRLDRLEHADAPEKVEESKAYQISRETRETIDNRKLNFHQDLDVRGMRGDEALNAVTYFIDDAILVGMSRVRILHGKGNGILRQLIRQYLSTVPNVTHYADEHVQFGGAGITVVDL
jgi:DNA mismatch repair protein MutS2